MVQIRFLADVPEHVDQLADWHHAQWSSLYTDWTHAVTRADLLDYTKCKTLPTTLVLLEDENLLGSASLLEEDAVELAAIGNAWLASLFVKPEARGRGFGVMLVKAIMQHAKDISIEEMFLFTPEHKTFYQQLGWTAFYQANLNGQVVDVMNYRINGVAQ
ncbi:MAG: GNAT family N-acetyltransferase [Arenimonas sp.]